MVEVVGSETFPKSWKVLSGSGTIAQIGVLTGFGSSTNLMRLQSINGNIVGISVGSRDHLQATADFIQTHAIEPIIDRAFSFDAVAAAYDHLRSGSYFGKIVIAIWPYLAHIALVGDGVGHQELVFIGYRTTR